MKTRVLFLFFAVCMLISCEKNTYQSSGTITGQDIRMCPCCGGYFIDVAGTLYLFEKSELPDKFTFNDEQLPLQVELDWKLKTEGCTGYNRITIIKIRAKL